MSTLIKLTLTSLLYIILFMATSGRMAAQAEVNHVFQLKNETLVTVSPTWLQSLAISFDMGYAKWLMLGIILVFAGIVLIALCRAGKRSLDRSVLCIGIGLVCLFTGLSAVYTLPGTVKRLEQTLPKSKYDLLVKQHKVQDIWKDKMLYVPVTSYVKRD